MKRTAEPPLILRVLESTHKFNESKDVVVASVVRHPSGRPIHKPRRPTVKPWQKPGIHNRPANRNAAFDLPYLPRVIVVSTKHHGGPAARKQIHSSFEVPDSIAGIALLSDLHRKRW
jgi:hypothetical protein